MGAAIPLIIAIIGAFPQIAALINVAAAKGVISDEQLNALEAAQNAAFEQLKKDAE